MILTKLQINRKKVIDDFSRGVPPRVAEGIVNLVPYSAAVLFLLSAKKVIEVFSESVPTRIAEALVFLVPYSAVVFFLLSALLAPCLKGDKLPIHLPL
jgi:hypothetical protein